MNKKVEISIDSWDEQGNPVRLFWVPPTKQKPSGSWLCLRLMPGGGTKSVPIPGRIKAQRTSEQREEGRSRAAKENKELIEGFVGKEFPL